MPFTTSLVGDLLVVASALLLFAYVYTTRRFNYWSKRGVRHLAPTPFFGNFVDVFFFRKTIAEWLKGLYDANDDVPYFGLFVFDRPHLVIKSPELVKQVLVKDFANFSDRTVATPKHNELLANMLFLQKGQEWKTMRAKMTPIFTSGKLKNMFHLMDAIGDELIHYLGKRSGTSLEAKEVCSKYSTDVISKCAFGINAHCFDDDDADFRRIGRAMFDFTLRNGFAQTAYFFMQNVVNVLRIDFWESWIQEYFVDAFWKTMGQRGDPKGKPKDVIDMLREIMKNEEFCKDLKFEGAKVAAQATQFFAAGFETTSSTIAFTLYELALNHTVQDKLRQEIFNNVKENNGFTYEGIMQMKYLEMCIFETLRKYPVLAFLDRRCNEDYKLPGTNLVLEKGLPVYIPMFGLHMDEKYFPEPTKYKPERFLENINAKANGLVYIPFGEGPRICIGERFGMLGSKLALARIIYKFTVDRCPETPVPIEFEPKSFVMQSKVGLPMVFKRHVSSPA